MGDHNKLQQLLSKLAIFSDIFEIVRIVNPLKKVVLAIDGEIIYETALTCYGFWSRNQQCINCISMRAYTEKEAFAKIEYNNEAIFLMLSLPYAIDDTVVIIELMKDVTKSMLLLDNTEKTQEMNVLIANLNKALLTDPLTGIYNRRFINERLPVDIMKSTLNNQPTSIILADIDHFKWVNDEHGHIAGDYVLSCVAKQLQSLIDTDCWAARYGGEEFLICLSATETQAAAAVAEKMRAAIEAAPIKYECATINITMSFGVSTIQGENIPMETFIDAADQKMYTAKQNGRNQVVS